MDVWRSCEVRVLTHLSVERRPGRIDRQWPLQNTHERLNTGMCPALNFDLVYIVHGQSSIQRLLTQFCVCMNVST